jgi:hypothetical protein
MSVSAWLAEAAAARLRKQALAELLGKARTADPIDAAVVLIAADGESVVASAPDDIGHLARVAGRKLVVVAC